MLDQLCLPKDDLSGSVLLDVHTHSDYLEVSALGSHCIPVVLLLIVPTPGRVTNGKEITNSAPELTLPSRSRYFSDKPVLQSVFLVSH